MFSLFLPVTGIRFNCSISLSEIFTFVKHFLQSCIDFLNWPFPRRSLRPRKSFVDGFGQLAEIDVAVYLGNRKIGTDTVHIYALIHSRMSLRACQSGAHTGDDTIALPVVKAGRAEVQNKVSFRDRIKVRRLTAEHPQQVTVLNRIVRRLNT